MLVLSVTPNPILRHDLNPRPHSHLSDLVMVVLISTISIHHHEYELLQLGLGLWLRLVVHILSGLELRSATVSSFMKFLYFWIVPMALALLSVFIG